MRRIYVFFFVELSTRRVHLAGITEKLDGPSVAQQARNLSWELSDREIPVGCIYSAAARNGALAAESDLRTPQVGETDPAFSRFSTVLIRAR